MGPTKSGTPRLYPAGPCAAYQSVILPAHNYCSAVYNSSITKKQELELERLQAQALKSIYRCKYSYAQLLVATGLTTLKARRDKHCDKFAMKARRGKFASWFPLNEQQRTTRNTLKYREEHERTERLRRSPSTL